MNQELLVICSEFFRPAHKIETAVTSFLKDYKNCTLLIILDNKLEVEGHTFGDKDLIEIEINSKAKDPFLVLGHELVHAKQILEGRPFSEDEAYGNEKQVCEFIKNSLAI